MFPALTRIALVAGIGCGMMTPAWAAPYGGASLLRSHTEAQPARGFQVSAPDLIGTGEGMRFHGSVCRATRLPVTEPQIMRLDHLDREGQVIATSVASLAGQISARTGLGCAYYDVRTDWTIGPAETVRASIF